MADDAVARAKAAWRAAKAKSPARKGAGTVEWAENAAGYVVLRGRLVHHGRTYLTPGVGLGARPTRAAVFAADAEARDRLRDLAAKLRRGFRPDPGRERRTVRAQVDRWLEAARLTAPRTVAQYRALAAHHVDPYRIADVALRDLSEDDLPAWLHDLDRAGVPVPTQRLVFDKLLAALKAFLAGGEAPSVRTVVSAAGRYRPRYRPARPEPLDEAQAQAFLAHLTGGQAREPYATLFALQLLCGLRWGEAAGVRARDVHGLRWDDRAALSVAQQIDKNSRTPVPPKTEAGERTVPLNAEAVALLRRYLDGKSFAPDDLLFSYRGQPVAWTTCRGWFDKFGEASGLGRLGKTHRLRHTFATLGGGETQTPVLGGLMGHRDAKSTSRYTGLREADMRAASERIGRRMSGKPGPG